MKKKFRFFCCRLFTLSFQQRAPLRKRCHLLLPEKRTTKSKITGRHSSRRAGRFTPMTSTPLAALACALSFLATVRGAEPLPSWNDTAPKKAIVDFVERVTKEGSPDFVKPEERIATFDNDGRVWWEQPMYFQMLFALDRVKALAPQHPEWKTKEPFASLLKGDVKGALAGGERAMLEIIIVTHAGMTTAEFEQIVKDWIATA